MSRYRSALAATVAAACLLVLAACGAPAGHPPPMARATWGDNAQQVSLVQGQELEVRLTGSSCNPTSVPVASAPAVLKVDAIGRDAEGGAWARFRGQTSGTSAVTAINSPQCGGPTSGEASYTFRMTVSVR